ASPLNQTRFGDPIMSLQGMRNSAKSWVMLLLFGLLILSFGLWGIGDVFRTGVRGNETVAEVGGIEISVDEYRRELRSTLQTQGRRLGITLNMTQARALGIDRRVLSQMIEERVIGQGASGIGIVISQDLVARDIQKNPNFKNQFDQFDRTRFIRLLANNGLSEAGYVALRQGELARLQLAQAVAASRRMPRMMLERFYHYQNDKRVAEILFIADASIKRLPRPSPAQLAAYHKKNARAFTAPELRAITAIILTPEAVAGEVLVNDDDLRKAYAERKAEFVTAEKREVEQMLLTSEADARKAHAALVGGDSFEKVAREIAGQKAGGLALGTFAKSELKTRMAALAEAAFKVEIGKFSAPVKSALGWHILRVTKIVGAQTKGFDSVKAQIRLAIQKDRAGDLLVKLSNQIEDALGAGSSLEEVARRLNLKAVKFAGLDRRGNDIDAKKVKGLPKTREFLTRAFAIDLDEDSGVVESEQGTVFILRVDKITKPALRPLASVRAKVAAAWEAGQRREAARKKAKALLEKANGGESLASLAKAAGTQVRTTGPFTRTGRKAGKNVSGGLITKVFKARVSATVMARSGNGYALARLKDIRPASPGGDKAGMDAVRKALTDAINADLLASYTTALKERYTVEINRDVIRQIFANNPR
ncbi:MAG: SurA N-terminal domain-containing protein, partial [Alphaproteobacteria bacterium]